MCFDVTNDSRTPAQRQYRAAIKDILLANDAMLRAEAAELDAIAALKAENPGQGDDAELIFDLSEEAIERSGLGEDNQAVKAMRQSFQVAIKIREAITNGADPQTAAFIALAGEDPRRLV